MLERERYRSLRDPFGVLLAILYAASVLSFWWAGTVAYLRGFHGPGRFAGLLYLPSLLLPGIGRGSISGFPVRSSIWIWWFLLQLGLASAAILVNARARRPRST